jgi:hypothetical protein
VKPSFNTAGPCFPDEHYMLPPERRLGRVMELIDDGKYFTLQAGRQTGKTTSAQWLAEHYNAGQRFRAIWVDIEEAREQPDPAKAFRAVIEALSFAVERKLKKVGPPPESVRSLADPLTVVRRYLQDLASRCPLPLVVLVDEADGLVGEAMVSFLTQLRTGYIARREAPFPHSVALIGARNVQDYVVSQEERRAISWLGTTSPFNIAAEAASIGPFSAAEVLELLTQHTARTGQCFEPAAASLIHELSQGHPWLVNALADHIVDRAVRDRSVPVTATHVEAAQEAIILERRTHIDSLVARLREPRVRRILDPMLAGDRAAADTLHADLAYVIGLGIVRIHEGHAEIANPIYREAIPRALSHDQQVQIIESSATFVRPRGSLDMAKLMNAFQVFWRKDGHLAAEGFGYRESGPHLMLMAFLQRIVDGRGRIDREYALGRGALDLLVTWREERHAIEVKLRRDTETEGDALEQVTRYLDHAGLAEGWLVMFDLRSTRPWSERLTRETFDWAGKQIHLVGC